jgi:exodeoxyribonuclease VII large subunit
VTDTASEAVLELSVGEFSRRFALMVASNPKLQRIAIVGEITDIRWSPERHLNMKLKEGEALLSCFSFASEARRFPPIRAGLKVRAEGSIAIWSVGSLYQLRALSLSLVGEGKLAAEIEELRLRLRAEGAFDSSRKRDVPTFPRRIALVTSDDDARADFDGRMRADAPQVEIFFVPTRVQGKGAEVEVAEAMDRASRANVDVVVLTRGGGSSDDRLTFNKEAVVRAILRSRHPVVTALGHLKNMHLADEVADLALATPTAAAVALAQEWRRALERMRIQRLALLRGFRSALAGKTQSVRLSDVALDRAGANFLSRRAEHARALERRLDQSNPAARVAQWRVGLVRANTSLSGWSSRGLDRYATLLRARNDALERLAENVQQQWLRRVERAESALKGEDPTRPLARGFAIVSKDGVVVHDVAALAPGDAVLARLQRGTFGARVESVHAE